MLKSCIYILLEDMCDRYILNKVPLLFSFSPSVATVKADIPAVIFKPCSNLKDGKQNSWWNRKEKSPCFLDDLKETLN